MNRAEQERMSKAFEGIFDQMGMGGGAGAEAMRLVRENNDLKKKLAEADKTIETLRTSKKFYQENFGKAKAAYEKEVAKRHEREAADRAAAEAEANLRASYDRALSAHNARDDPGFTFPTFEEWRK